MNGDRPKRLPRLHAIYVVLNEEPFIATSLRSIYDYADRITVVTSYDCDWAGNAIEPDQTLSRVLGFPDPIHKINVVRTWIPDEAIARNWAMHAALHKINYRFVPHAVDRQQVERRLAPPDYFWIVDGDEIYDERSVEAILEFVGKSRAKRLSVSAANYFKTWNYQISESEAFTAFVRPGVYLGTRRSPYYSALTRYGSKIPVIGAKFADVLTRSEVIPPDIGIFHHGAYVGDRKRIEKKLLSGSHSDEILQGWIDDVWAHWTPDTRDFHPVRPELFSSVTEVATEDLPRLIAESDWPQGYMGIV